MQAVTQQNVEKVQGCEYLLKALYLYIEKEMEMIEKERERESEISGSRVTLVTVPAPFFVFPTQSDMARSKSTLALSHTGLPPALIHVVCDLRFIAQ